MNPDSAVANDSEREAQAFCSTRSLSLRLIRLCRKWSLPLSGHQPSVLGDHYEIDSYWYAKSKTTF